MASLFNPWDPTQNKSMDPRYAKPPDPIQATLNSYGGIEPSTVQPQEQLRSPASVPAQDPGTQQDYSNIAVGQDYGVDPSSLFALNQQPQLSGATPGERINNLSKSVSQLSSLPDVQEQKKGISDIQSILALQASQPSSDPGWVKPLLALADSQNGSNLSQGLPKTIAPEEKTNNLIKSLEDIQKRKEDVAKELLSNAAAINKQNPMDMAEYRQVMMAHRTNLSAVKKDPVLNDMFGRYSVVNNAISNLTNAHNLTPQQFHESQMAIRNTLFPKGVSSGVDERASNYLQNAGYNVDNLIQTISGKPASISQNDPDIRHIEELAQNMKTNFNENAKRRINFVTSGNDWIYEDPKYTHLADSLQKTVASGMAQFQPTQNAQAGLKKQGIVNGKVPIATPSANAALERTTVTGPNGEKKTIPSSQVDQFLSDPAWGGKGWKK